MDYPDPRTFLGHTVKVVIDRPYGSHHPTHGFAYPVNYGYLPGIPAPDGEDLDAYVLGVEALPLSEFTGICIAVVHRLDDTDDKLVVVPAGVTLTDDQVRQAVHFQEQYFQSEILRIGVK